MAIDAGRHIIQDVTDKKTLKEAIFNVPGGIIEDYEKLALGASKGIGQIGGQGIKGLSEGLLGDSNLLWELALAGGAIYLFSR